MPIALTDLPNEVIFQILLQVPPSSAHTLQQVSRRINDLTQPLLWKNHCRTQFRYWSQEHRIQEKFAEKAYKIDWKKIFSDRQIVVRFTTREIDDILASQQGRIGKAEKIVGHGYDTKDALLRNLNINDEAPDVLARRYYSDAVLTYLHRTMAVREWVKVKNGSEVPLERALAAFDMFVLHEREGDLDDVSAQLDDIAQLILVEIPDIAEHSPRRKAMEIASYLRRNNLTGIKNEEGYRDLQNNFIGIALQDKDHPSLPIISVAIYCCVAKRLGLDASPCGFPFHVVAVIKSGTDKDLNGKVVENPLGVAPMYMDPFHSDDEVPVANLRSQLAAMGVAVSEYNRLLDKSSIADIVRRTAFNIIAAVHQSITRNHGDHAPTIDTESAFYCALWALLLLPEGNSTAANAQRTRYLPHVVEHLEKHFHMDVCLIEDHILHLFQNFPHYEQLRHTLGLIRDGDTMPKPVKKRTQETSQNVRYHIGQVFKHKRYNYQAVITGWDMECSATEDWIFQMHVDHLSGGRLQSFYHVLVEDKSVRYVAEENIEIVQHQVSQKLMKLAGQYFKRWDLATKTFISNIKDEYPDD